MARRPIDYKVMRDLIRPRQVLDIVGWAPVRYSGRNEVGRCLNCRDEGWRRGCLLVGTRVAKCLRCGWFGDALALACLITRYPVYETAGWLCRRLGIDVPYIEQPKPST